MNDVNATLSEFGITPLSHPRGFYVRNIEGIDVDVPIFEYKRIAETLLEQKQRIAELENPWISVDERLPEIGQHVIVTGEHSTFVALYRPDLDQEFPWVQPAGGGLWSRNNRRAWMPIPPTKGEGE